MLRIALRLDHQFRGEQALLLVLRHMRPFHNVRHKLRPKREEDVIAVDIPCLLLVHDEQVIPTRMSRHIDVFPQLDVALRPEYEQPTIAPGP